MNILILADHQTIYRAGAAAILSRESDLRVVAQCADTERLLGALDTFRGSLVVFASALGADPYALIPRVAAAQSRSIVIAENGEPVRPWFAAGVRGAVDRQITSPALVECVRRVGGGERSVQARGMAGPAIDGDEAWMQVRERLAPKEVEIVGHIAQGFKNREIAVCLNTTEQAIKKYLHSIYQKAGVSDRLELALFAIHHRKPVGATICGGRGVLIV